MKREKYNYYNFCYCEYCIYPLIFEYWTAWEKNCALYTISGAYGLSGIFVRIRVFYNCTAIQRERKVPSQRWLRWFIHWQQPFGWINNNRTPDCQFYVFSVKRSSSLSSRALDPPAMFMRIKIWFRINILK